MTVATPPLDAEQQPAPPPPPGPSLGLRLLSLYSRGYAWAATSRLSGWWGPLLVTAIGGFLRFYRLTVPRELNFDESYYVKYGASMLFWGIVRAEREDFGEDTPVDDVFNAGTPNVFQDAPDMIVHPPGGPSMIAIGMKIFGISNPFGWRFTAALVGTLSILIVARVGRRLFHSTLLGSTAGLLLAVDGNHLVLSRVGILDVFVMFWALVAFACILIDRDQTLARLRTKVAGGADLSGIGPGLGRWRPWRLAAAVALGLCISVKWSGVPFFAAFGLATVLWDAGARRSVGQPHWLRVGLIRDGWAGLWQMGPLLFATYMATWAGWFASARFGRGADGKGLLAGYDRFWGAQHPTSNLMVLKWMNWAPDWLRSWLAYHRETWLYHIDLTEPHESQANPWTWIIGARPTSMWYEEMGKGDRGCKVDACVSGITSIANPVVWWGATLSLGVLIFCWLLRRDWRAGAILCGLAGSWLYWFLYQERTIFQFYAVAMTPWVVLTLTYTLGMMLGKPDAPLRRRRRGALAAGSIVALACAALLFFYPVLTNVPLPTNQYQWRLWLPSWRF
ncbi:MAG: phospholipid carrier-dependent glycosyltransferase [Kineosporiaceae bacterium]